MHHSHKAILEPFADTFAEMYETVRGMSDEELERLDAACSATTTTNCWWATYDAAQYLKRTVDTERTVRARLAQVDVTAAPVTAKQDGNL